MYQYPEFSWYSFKGVGQSRSVIPSSLERRRKHQNDLHYGCCYYKEARARFLNQFGQRSFNDFEMPLEFGSGNDSNLDKNVLSSNSKVILPARHTGFCILRSLDFRSLISSLRRPFPPPDKVLPASTSGQSMELLSRRSRMRITHVRYSSVQNHWPAIQLMRPAVQGVSTGGRKLMEWPSQQYMTPNPPKKSTYSDLMSPRAHETQYITSMGELNETLMQRLAMEVTIITNAVL